MQSATVGAQYHLHMYQAPLKQPYLMRVRSPETIIPPKAQPCGRPAASLEEGFPPPRHVEVDSLSSDVSMSSKATSGRMPTPLSGGSNINREVVAMQNMDCQNAVVF